MNPQEPLTFYFEDDGTTPNSSFPVLIYKNILNGIDENHSDLLETRFRENNWTNNWRDIILSEDHYHSTTHEVLGIGRGSIMLRLGGVNGKSVQVSVGDVLIIPAGVAHCSLEDHSDYEVVGGYPEGRSWDMIYCEPDEYLRAKNTIGGLSIPLTDPIFGLKGPLVQLWAG